MTRKSDSPIVINAANASFINTAGSYTATLTVSSPIITATVGTLVSATIAASDAEGNSVTVSVDASHETVTNNVWKCQRA